MRGVVRPRRCRRCSAPAAGTARSGWSTCSTGSRWRPPGPRCWSGSPTSPPCTRRSPPGSGSSTIHGPVVTSAGGRATTSPRDAPAVAAVRPGRRHVAHRRRRDATLVPGRAEGVAGRRQPRAAGRRGRAPATRCAPPSRSWCSRTSARRSTGVDRLLTQLLRTGWFDGVRGIVLGRVHRLRVPDGGARTWSRDRLAPLGVPLLWAGAVRPRAAQPRVPVRRAGGARRRRGDAGAARGGPAVSRRGRVAQAAGGSASESRAR